MFAFIKSFFTKSVDSIVADISDRVEQLHVVADAKALEAKLHDEEVAARTFLRDLATKEVARAKAIAAKFEALIS